jgi:tetratricopeptide (TPR) repeat protein
MRIKALIQILVIAGIAFCGVSLFAQNAAYPIREGQKYIRSGQFVEALEMLNLAILKDPSVPELYYLRGYAKYSLDDYLGAEQDYSRALEISPSLPDVLVNRSLVRSLLTDFNGAYDDLSKAQKIDSTNIGIYISLAKLKLYLKKFYGCIGDCKTAIRLGCEDESAWLLKGTAEWSLERYDEAAADFRKAMLINPVNSYPNIQLGSMYLEREQTDSAIFYLSRAIEMDSNNLYAIFNRSLALIKKPDLEQAKADLDKVIRLSPYNSYAWFNRALLLYEKKDREGAVRDLGVVIKLNPQHVTSYYYRGAIRSELKDYKGALEDLDKAIALYSDNPDAWMARSEVKLKLKDPAGAQKDYQKALEISEKDPVHPDKLSDDKKSYLESIVKMSGDFEEMNTTTSKFQNQFIDIQLREMFYIFTGKAPFDRIRLYDTYGKQHYPSNIIMLSNVPGLASDSAALGQVDKLTLQIETGREVLPSLFKRAVALSTLQKYNLAFADYDSLLRIDSSYVLGWFSRAVTRYGLIRLIRSLNDYEDQITIGRSTSGLRDQIVSNEPEHTFAMVAEDLGRAISLDPDFYFAYYNRGFVYCAMGEYDKALADFTAAIGFRENFAEALYNRGLIYILKNETIRGCEDLSRAGELGITDAYRVIKRYCYK